MKIDTPHTFQLSALRSLWQEAFGDTDEFLNTFTDTAFSMDRCRCITIEKDKSQAAFSHTDQTGNSVIAALYWFDCIYNDNAIAYLYAVATAKAFRGQGLCHKLMEDTHQHLKKLGYKGVILVPGSKELFQLYESIGYKTCSEICQFSCTAKKTKHSAQLHSIDKTEYTRLRRQMLPEGGVIQEHENIDFLSTQANFYTGSGFLLAAHKENNTLYGIELLGDTTAAAEILQSLGCSKGTFRTPGKGIPFAMYYPLKENTTVPKYFGLAFD